MRPHAESNQNSSLSHQGLRRDSESQTLISATGVPVAPAAHTANRDKEMRRGFVANFTLR